MSLLSLRAKLLGGLSLALILGFVAYCHHRDTGLVQQGVNQERTRVADSVITVTDTVFRRDTAWLATALSRRDSQLIATRFELANAINEKPADTQSASTGGQPGQPSPSCQTDLAAFPLRQGCSALTTAPTDAGHRAKEPATTIQHLVRVCNTQIADDSTALAAALSALHTCEANGAAWKARAQIVQPKPSRVKPFVAGAVTGMAALAAIIHFVK